MVNDEVGFVFENRAGRPENRHQSRALPNITEPGATSLRPALVGKAGGTAILAVWRETKVFTAQMIPEGKP